MEKNLISKKVEGINYEIGTSLIGYVNLNYNELKSIFGKPNSGDSVSGTGDSKIDWEWTFTLNNLPFSIYNWKTGPSYLHKKSIKPKDIEVWNVGSTHEYNLKILEDFIKQETGDKFNDRKLTRTEYKEDD